MPLATCARCSFVLLLLLPSPGPAAAQQADGAPPPALRVQALGDATAFSGRETLVDFEVFAQGTPISTQLAAAGVLFGRAEGYYPAVWSDLQPRSSGPSGASALNNFLASASGPGLRTGDPGAAAEASVLRLRFLVPVNRAGFELRSEGAAQRNALLACLARGRVQQTLFFDLEAGYRFVGLESTRPTSAWPCSAPRRWARTPPAATPTCWWARATS